MLRENIEMGRGVVLVLLRDEDGCYIRVLAQTDGRPTFQTRKIDISMETIQAFGSWYGNPEPFMIERFTMTEDIDFLILDVPFHGVLRVPRKQWRIMAYRAFDTEATREK